MDYKHQKGYFGEIQFAELITRAIGEYGYKAERIGSTEAGKKWLFGDVAIVNDKDKNCVLSEYFLENKRRATPQVWNIVTEAESNAKQYNRAGAITRIERMKKYQKKSERILVMSEDTFARLLNELQGWREQFNNGTLVVNE